MMTVPDGMVYCPYTDREIPVEKSNSEHIIPLSLGGVSGFEIPVDRGFNSRVGSELDGRLSNEFLWALVRTRHDSRGHSGKKPFAIIKTAQYGKDDRLAQVYFHQREGLRVWDVRNRKYMRGKGRIQISTTLNIDMPGRDCFGVGVGLLGHYLAMVNVPARTDSFPNEGDFAWGHVVKIVDKKLKRCSWVEGLRRWTGMSEQLEH